MKRRSSFYVLAVTAMCAVMALVWGFRVDAQRDDRADTSPAVPELSTTIVISQVYPGGGSGAAGVTYMKDYVEIKNISASAQPISGLSLQYGSATGNFGSVATNIYTLTGSLMLAPGQYYLVELAMPGAMGGPIVPTPNESTTNLSMAAASGKVALTNTATALGCGATATPCTLPSASIIDVVSWGASNNGEGGTTVNNGVALPANTNGAVRKTAGCTETDNNNLDFDVVVNPVPRNAASPAAPCSAVPQQNYIDMNGDGKTDYSVVRNTGGGPGGQMTWFTQYNGLAGTQTDAWGISGDFFVPGNYDGDDKTDVAIWRPGPVGSAGWYILQSATSTLRAETFGQSGDDPRVQGDYNGDGHDDIAVYRAGATAGAQSFWYWQQAPGGPIFAVQWGQNGDFPAPGEYDSDGKNDFVVQRNAGGGQARFWALMTTDGMDSAVFGTPTDVIVPGDYDGDGTTDLAVIRGSGGQILWWVRPSSGAADYATFFGASATDFPVQGDYDGDGKTDIAIWRPNADPNNNNFWVNKSTGGILIQEWGQNGDYPVANYNAH